MLNIEFFHSVVCGHCFIMSDRLRKITDKYQNINIIHRSHSLNWSEIHKEDTFVNKHEETENQIRKWEIANRIDDHHRFNLDGVKKGEFNELYARLPMIAIRAAVLAGGDEWDIFDAFQSALYVDNLDISDEEIIAQIVENQDIDFGIFLKYYEDSKTEELIFDDFNKFDNYQMKLVPALVIEGKHIIEGTKRLDLAEELILRAAKAERIELIKY